MTKTWEPLFGLVKRIPKAHVVTYGGLARMAKLRGGAREAGHAMASCPQGKGIPWHRVVGSGGKLLIREPFASLQRKLLASEGTTFLGNTRVDLSKHQWQPSPARRKAKARRKIRQAKEA